MSQAANVVDLTEKRVGNFGERQAAPRIEGIRVDHVARYKLAASLIKPNQVVLDAACGVGYGSRLIADKSQADMVLGVDISEDAIRYGKRHYESARCKLRRGDCCKLDIGCGLIDVVVSFETIEHLDAHAFLKEARRVLRHSGYLIASTPNQNVLPFDQEAYPYHLRHYTPQELMNLMAGAGFVVRQAWSNVDRFSGDVVAGWSGPFNIVLASPV